MSKKEVNLKKEDTPVHGIKNLIRADWKRFHFGTFVFVFLWLIGAKTSTSFSQEKTFTLKEACDFAVKNSYQTQSASINAGIAEKNIKSYIGSGLPQINAEGKFQNFLDVPTTVIPNFIGPAITGSLIQSGLLPPSAANQPPNPEFLEAKFGTKYNVSGGINASQLIFSGTYFVGLEAAKTYSLAAKQGLEKTETEVRESVAQTYHTILVAKESEKILELSKKNLEKTLFETNQLYKTGFAEETSAQQLELLVSNLTNGISSARQQIENAFQLLKFQMGIPATDKILLSDSLGSLINNLPPESILSSNADLKNHIDFKLISTQERLMTLSERAEKTKFLPSLVGFFSYQQSALRNEFNFTKNSEKWFPATLWGLSLQVPVFSGFSRYHNLGKARLELEKTRILKTQVEQGLQLQLQTARADFLTAHNQYLAEKGNVSLAEKIRDKTIIKFNQGLASSMELTQSENQLLATQGNYFRSMYQLLNAKTKLEKIIGNK